LIRGRPPRRSAIPGLMIPIALRPPLLEIRVQA
jgi:hypothetical protein